MVDIIPNQQGESVQEDKEKDIIENGGEIITDDISNIKLINVQEYNALPDSEKELWVKYNPSLTSIAYANLLTTQNELIEQFNKLGALINKAPSMQSLDELISAIQPIETIANMVDPLISTINSIASMEIVGVVAKPLEDLLKLIGAVAALLYAMFRNPFLMIKEYQQALASIDIDGIKNYFEGDLTPNLDVAQMELKEIVIPDEEIQQYVNDNIEKFNSQKEIVENAVNTTELLKETEKKAEEVQTAIETSTLIISMGTAELMKQAITNSFNKMIDQTTKDYTADSQALASSVNEFIKNLPQKYIKVSDLEKLKNIEQSSENS